MNLINLICFLLDGSYILLEAARFVKAFGINFKIINFDLTTFKIIFSKYSKSEIDNLLKGFVNFVLRIKKMLVKRYEIQQR